MLQEQIILYIRENILTVAMVAGGLMLFLLLVTFFQVSRMRREVHKICKKIRKYFDVVLSEDEPSEQKEQAETVEHVQIPVYQTAEGRQKQQEEQKRAEDARLLMDIIQEVF